MNIMTILQFIWKKKWGVLAGGLLIGALVFAYSLYSSHYTYTMRLSYVYPSVKDGLYPDGTRFMPEDIVDRDRVAEALQVMQQRNWYTELTVDQVLKGLTISTYQTESVQERVQSLRTSGEDFTFYSNEYMVTFRQPNTFHLLDIGTGFGLLRANRGKELLEELYQANLNAFLAEHTEGGIFQNFSEYLIATDADYDQTATIYEDKATLCMNNLIKKRGEDNTFVSVTTGKTFNDLVIAYQTLIDVEINRLYKYATASKLTRNYQELSNLIKVSVEKNQLISLKKADEYEIAQGAMMEYDHTFSENIIIVSVNPQDGLYQARPKTGYDTVTQQALSAGVESSNAANEVTEDERRLSEYQQTTSSAASVQKMRAEADQMEAEMVSKYQQLANTSAQTINDYLEKTNMSYIKTAVVVGDAIGLTDLVKSGMGFLLGAVLIALICLANEIKRQSQPIPEAESVTLDE